MDLNLGDRHNREIEGLGVRADPKVVRIRAGQISGSIPRQHLLVCLVNLLARLHGSVKSIQLEVEGQITAACPHKAAPHSDFASMV